MANYASLVITESSTPLLLGNVFSIKFDNIDILLTSDNVLQNETGYFGTGADGAFDQWAPKLRDAIYRDYINPNGLIFEAILYDDKLELLTWEYGHKFEDNLTTVSYTNIIVTDEVVPIIIAISGISIVTAPLSVDRSVFCTYYVSVQNFTGAFHIKTLPSGALNERVFGGSIIAFEYFRQHTQPEIIVVDSLGAETPAVKLPRLQTWSIDNVIVNLFDATILAKNVGIYDVATTLTYSINGTNYYTSNYFSGLSVSIYTAYILDSKGGVWTKQFTVLNLTNKPAAFVDISDVNSLQFRDAALSGNYKSLFSKQKFTNIEDRCFAQTFRSSLITTQIRSSYDNIVASMDGINYPVIKVVDNLNQLDWRDCQFADGGNNKTLVYFESGNIYDPLTSLVSGTYNNVTVLGIKLDDWQTVGNVLAFTFGTFKVSAVVRNSSINGMALVIDTPFQSFVPEICKTTYNIEDWNVFEVDIDMGLLDTTIEHQMTIDFTDSAYPAKQWISEPFTISSDDSLIELVYSGEQTINNMIPTGIDHRIYLEAQFFDYEPKTEIETFEDDRMNEITLKRSLAQNIILKTHAIPQYLAHKIGLAMLFDTIYVDGLPFEPVNQAKISSFVDKNNPFLTLVQAFRPIEDVSISNESTDVVNRVLGASTITVLGA